MLVKTLLKDCETGFDLVIIADSVSGHTMEFDSVKNAQIVAGSDKVISWEVGQYEEFSRGVTWHRLVLFITI